MQENDASSQLELYNTLRLNKFVRMLVSKLSSTFHVNINPDDVLQALLTSVYRIIHSDDKMNRRLLVDGEFIKRYVDNHFRSTVLVKQEKLWNSADSFSYFNAGYTNTIETESEVITRAPKSQPKNDECIDWWKFVDLCLPSSSDLTRTELTTSNNKRYSNVIRKYFNSRNKKTVDVFKG